MTKKIMMTLPIVVSIFITSISQSAGSKLPEKQDWVYFEQNSSKILRGYDTEAFSSEVWSKKDRCFFLDSHGFGSDLMTQKKYEEFEMEFDWKLVPGGNSGILFAVQTGEVYSYMSGLEIQLLDDARHPDGKIAIASLGALYNLSEPILEAKNKLKLNEMNSSRLIVTKERAKFFMNDILVGDYSLLAKEMSAKIANSKFQGITGFYSQRAGHILFQDHGGKATFCNIRVRSL